VEEIYGVNNDKNLLIGISTRIRFNLNKLSPRECECIRYMMRGMTTKQIAAVLCLSPRTVEGYIANVKNKLNCKNRYEIISKVLGENFPWEELFKKHL
jgi:DNA-binding CsgD family transcriptional regulator